MSQPTLVDKWLNEAGGFTTEKAVQFAKNDRIRGDNAKIWGRWLPKWAPQMAQNYAMIKNGMGVRFLSDAAKGIPAIVVGIGPSLDDEIETLKYARPHALIISTDAAVRVLYRHGIHPDLVIQLDCKKENVTMFDDVATQDMVLVANSCVHPSTINRWMGKFLFYNMALDESEFMTHVLPYIFPKFGAIDTKSTVGNMAILLAHLMGCSKIIGVGIDLCYGKNEDGAFRYRAKDYRLAEGESGTSWEEKENKVLYDNDDRLSTSFDLELRGKTYKVDNELDFYRKSLIDMVGIAGIEYVNTAKDSPLAQDIETMTLEAALQKYGQPPFEDGETVVRHLMKIIPPLDERS